jgi:hypothetical protein
MPMSPYPSYQMSYCCVYCCHICSHAYSSIPCVEVCIIWLYKYSFKNKFFGTWLQHHRLDPSTYGHSMDTQTTHIKPSTNQNDLSAMFHVNRQARMNLHIVSIPLPTFGLKFRDRKCNMFALFFTFM